MHLRPDLQLQNLDMQRQIMGISFSPEDWLQELYN